MEIENNIKNNSNKLLIALIALTAVNLLVGIINICLVLTNNKNIGISQNKPPMIQEQMFDGNMNCPKNCPMRANNQDDNNDKSFHSSKKNDGRKYSSRDNQNQNFDSKRNSPRRQNNNNRVNVDNRFNKDNRTMDDNKSKPNSRMDDNKKSNNYNGQHSMANQKNNDIFKNEPQQDDKPAEKNDMQ